MNQGRINALMALAEQFGIQLARYELVNTALTHPSYTFEKDLTDLDHNQRLEFLGDAVVDLVVGDYLFHEYPQKLEGELTKMRAALVCESSLANAARRAGLGDYLLMGKGEKNCGGQKRASNLADAWEALMGALYLELGIDAVRPIIIGYIQPEIEAVKKGQFGDYKTQLQEIVQKNPDAQISYQIISEEGPDHDKLFVAQVTVNQQSPHIGRGKTKKEAEQNAALQALIALGEVDE